MAGNRVFVSCTFLFQQISSAGNKVFDFSFQNRFHWLKTEYLSPLFKPDFFGWKQSICLRFSKLDFFGWKPNICLLFSNQISLAGNRVSVSSFQNMIFWLETEYLTPFLKPDILCWKQSVCLFFSNQISLTGNRVFVFSFQTGFLWLETEYSVCGLV